MAKYDKDDFRYSEDKGVWHNGTVVRVPTKIIKGNRMAHADYGKDAYGFNWSVSTLNHWHAGTGFSFDEAMFWVKDGEGSADDWWMDKPKPLTETEELRRALYKAGDTLQKCVYLLEGTGCTGNDRAIIKSAIQAAEDALPEGYVSPEYEEEES